MTGEVKLSVFWSSIGRDLIPVLVMFSGICITYMLLTRLDPTSEGFVVAVQVIAKRRRIFDCFGYNNEGHMTYLRVSTTAPYVDQYVMSFSNTSFTNRVNRQISFAPFETEMAQFSGRIHIMNSDEYRYGSANGAFKRRIAWRKEALHREILLKGVELFSPSQNDLLIVADCDEIITREGLRFLMNLEVPHWYQMTSILYMYTYRLFQWNKWPPVYVGRYGAINRSLNRYRTYHRKGCPQLPHTPVIHHCTNCFPRLGQILEKLQGFAHTEFSYGRYKNPNYILACFLCGRSFWTREKKGPLKVVPLDDAIWIPDDPRLKFFKDITMFSDLNDFVLNLSEIRMFQSQFGGGCTEIISAPLQ